MFKYNPVEFDGVNLIKTQNLEVKIFHLKTGKENMGEKKNEVVDNTELVPVEVTEEFLRENLYEVRGVKVMLDADLAEIYGYETKRLNEQVKRNIRKFPEDFMFQVSDEEVKILWSQNATAKHCNSMKAKNFTWILHNHVYRIRR